MFVLTFIYILCVAAFNPWGADQGEIWVWPKVLALTVALLLNLIVIVKQGATVKVDASWRRVAVLWGALLVVGLAATLLSPAPRRSLLGQTIYGDGLLYWFLLAGLMLTNALAVRADPHVFRAQLRGLLLGGVVFAASMFPQLADKSIDYTAGSGVFTTTNPELLLSGVHIAHQPIGLSSHRGHASVVTALTSLLALITLLRRWLSPWLTVPTLLVSSLALWFTDSRGGLLAALIGLLYLGGFVVRSGRGRVLFAATLGVLALSGGSYWLLQREADIEVRELPALTENVNSLTSNRSELWQQALWAFLQRPLLGYGFDGFGTALPYIHARSDPSIQEVLNIGDVYYSYSDGMQVHRGHIEEFYNKAHNVVLDWLVSVGIAGAALYAALVLYLLVMTARSSVAPLEALTVAYLAFTLTWYDSAQFTFLGFWGLSVGLAFAGQREKAEGSEALPGGSWRLRSENGVEMAKLADETSTRA